MERIYSRLFSGICILQKPTASRKVCISFLLVCGDKAAILVTTSIVMWWCPSYHVIPKNWISWAGLLTLLCFMTKSVFRMIWTVFSPFSKISSAMFPYMTLSMYLKCSHPFPVQPGSVQGKLCGCAPTPVGWVYWTSLQMKANCGLHSAVEEMEKGFIRGQHFYSLFSKSW